MLEYEYKKIGLRINKYRTAKKWSLKRMEELTGLNSTYIGRLENGTRLCKNIETLDKIASALEVGLDDLLKDNLTKYSSEPLHLSKYDYLLDYHDIKVLYSIFLLSNKILSYKF